MRPEVRHHWVVRMWPLQVSTIELTACCLVKTLWQPLLKTSWFLKNTEASSWQCADWWLPAAALFWATASLHCSEESSFSPSHTIHWILLTSLLTCLLWVLGKSSVLNSGIGTSGDYWLLCTFVSWTKPFQVCWLYSIEELILCWSYSTLFKKSEPRSIGSPNWTLIKSMVYHPYLEWVDNHLHPQEKSHMTVA